MGFMVIIILLPIVLPVALLSTVLNIMNLFLKNPVKPNVVDGLSIGLGAVLMSLFLCTWSLKDYDIALRISEDAKWHTPVATKYIPIIVFLELLGLTGYCIIRIFQLQLPPLVIVMSISCMIIGSIIAVIWMAQLSPHLIELDTLSFCIPLGLCIFPFNYIISCFVITKKVIREYTAEGQKRHYKNRILDKCNLLLQNSNKWPILAVLLMIPLLAIALLVLVVFGQQPNAVVKAFTETSDWLLSQKISPPPIQADGHYLCTVSLRGHRSVVKPLRYGIRKNEKIVVNRQLCVANAFEQFLQERVPKTHHFIRYIYDKYGYPLSKHINTPLSADIVYIFMKPLEWVFLITLYCLETRPEDRIARQYLPMDWLNQNL